MPLYVYNVAHLVQPWVRGYRTRAVPKEPGAQGQANLGDLHPLRGLWIQRE